MRSFNDKPVWLTSIVYAWSLQLLVRLIGLLLDVPSSPLGFREGGRVFVGWVLLYGVCFLAIEALLSLRRRWFSRPVPPAPYDPYLLAVAEMQEERRGEVS